MKRQRHSWARPLGSPVLLGLLLAALLLGAAAPAAAKGGSGSGGSQGDFTLSANYGPSFTGYLVRGGLRQANCPLCTTDVEPRYVVVDGFTGTIFYDSNSLSMVSLNDFAGTIALQILNLPAGVTSLTATSATLPRRGSVSVPLKLTAASDAPFGNATITVRATSGGIVHTLALPISVVDRMPTS